MENMEYMEYKGYWLVIYDIPDVRKGEVRKDNKHGEVIESILLDYYPSDEYILYCLKRIVDSFSR